MAKLVVCTIGMDCTSMGSSLIITKKQFINLGDFSIMNHFPCKKTTLHD